MKLIVWYLFICCCCFTWVVTSAKSGLIVTAPHTLRLGSLEKICFTVHGFLPQEKLHVNFVLKDVHAKNELFNFAQSTGEEHTIITPVTGPECFSFLVPASLGVTSAILSVNVSAENSAYKFEDMAVVQLQAPSYITFIQTDKPMYKPGQTIKFRILVVDNNLKPQLDSLPRVVIEDPSGSRMMQWTKVDVSNSGLQGLVDLEMPLSEEPVQGQWKITVWPKLDSTGAESQEWKTERPVTVEEYVLPKYEVALTPPSYIGLLMDNATATVCAKYTYGEPVKGLLDFSACLVETPYHWEQREPQEPTCFRVTQQAISGCADTVIPLTGFKLRSRDRSLWKCKLELSANVTEQGTGVVLSKFDDSTKLTQTLFQLSFTPHSRTTYKPGLPYSGMVLVTKPDGRPASGELVEISYRNSKTGSEYKDNVTTNRHGEAAFTLPTIGKSSSSVQIMASMPNYQFSYSEHITMPDSPIAYHQVTEWFSPSSSYLQIEPIADEPVPCDSTVTLNVANTVDLDVTSMTIFYQVMAQGDILAEGSSVRIVTPEQQQTLNKTERCPEGQRFNTCGSQCTRTCSNQNPMCVLMCVPRCECPRTAPLLFMSRCITANECPDMTCEHGQVFSECGGCVRTCLNPYPSCGSRCVPQCQCPSNRPILHRQKCIRLDQCPVEMLPESSPTTPSPTVAAEFVEKPFISLPLTLMITPKMSPLAHLVVYFVRDDGEVVADSIDIKIQPCVQNPVSLNFVESTALPGASTQLQLAATPDSVCSVHVIDKSVQVHGGSTRLTLEKVMEHLRVNELPAAPSNDYEYCKEQLGGDDNDYDMWGMPAQRPIRQRPIPQRSRRNAGELEEPQCPGEMVFHPCGTPCTLTCAMHTICVGACTPKCECPPDEPILFKGQCIKYSQCPNHRGNRRSHNSVLPSRRKRTVMPYPGGYYSEYKDSKFAFDDIGQAVLSDLGLQTRPCQEYQHYRYVVYNSMSRAAELADEYADLPVPIAPESKGSSPFKPAVDVRTFFPETWLWDLVTIGSEGRVDMTRTLPHTVTQWLGSAFCSNTLLGLGVSSETSINGFQPFFLSLNLPYSVIKGEIIQVPVTVFNYLSECLVVELTVKPTAELSVTGESTTQLCVCGSESQTHRYVVTPQSAGQLNVTVMAVTVDNNGACGNDVFMSSQIGVHDALIQPLLVELPGRKETYTLSELMCVPTGQSVIKEWEMTLPPTGVVQDSPRAVLQTVGDVMGPSLTGLDSLIRLPTGCGEQNMLNFAPNIFVMQYLNNTKQSSQSISSKALEFMRTGYQRELTYRLTDGSFSAFGQSDKEGSMWLTAFVTKSFAQASDFIYIDKVDLQKSIDWFINKQLENGCFPQSGRVLHKDMMGGITGDEAAPTSLTAFVLVSILEAKKYAIVQPDVIMKAFMCLEDADPSDSYTLALMAYAYTLYDPKISATKDILQRLQDVAIADEGSKHWELAPGKTVNVEITSYALLALTTKYGRDSVSDGRSIVMWLTKQRNDKGGFTSTQDTVIGLQALASYAALTFQQGVSMTITAQSSTGERVTFTINDDNRMLLQQNRMQVPGTVTVIATGNGCALVQLDVKYNVENSTTGQIKFSDQPEFSNLVAPAFNLVSSAHRVTEGKDQCKRRSINVCVSYDAADGKSNMAVVGVKMVSGWIPKKESIKMLLQNTTLELKRFDIGQNLVEFYFEQLTATQKCLKFEVEQMVEVSNVFPADVKVFDYYQPDIAVSQSYTITNTCGTKEEIPFLSPEEASKIKAKPPNEITQERVTAPTLEHAVIKALGIVAGTTTTVSPSAHSHADVHEPKLIAENVHQHGHGDEDLRKSLMCPKCFPKAPENIQELFCQAHHAFKVKVVSNNRKVKIQRDLRSNNKRGVNMTAELDQDDVCFDCELLANPGKGKLLILVPSGALVLEGKRPKATLRLRADTTVVTLKKSLESQLKQAKRSGC